MKLGALFETAVQERIDPVVKVADLDDERLLAGRRATDHKTIESRFGHRLTPTTDNIGQVVEQRLLGKTSPGARQVAQLYASRGGALRDVGELAGTTRTLPDCAAPAFVSHYPFLPYQLPLIVELVRSLRGKAGRADLFSGSTRTLLGVAQDVLRAGRRYDVVVANPPYIDKRHQGAILRAFLREHYPAAKGNTFAAFILRCPELAEAAVGMVTPQTFLFVRSYERLGEQSSSFVTT